MPFLHLPNRATAKPLLTNIWRRESEFPPQVDPPPAENRSQPKTLSCA
ncbi:MAG: hypothetical protein ABH861_04565 [Patescibacteria group bacterium]